MNKEKDIQDSYLGKIKFFNKKRGYGFIVSEHVEKDIFFHFSSINNFNTEMLFTNDIPLSFNIIEGSKGIYAKNINYLETSINKHAVQFKQFVLFLGGVINEEIKKNKIKIF